MVDKIKTYSVTLEEEVVDEAKRIADFYGGKLSPVINSLLKQWIAKENSEDNQEGKE